MSKDVMIGGGTAVALLGVIVYNQYKFGKLQEQIDELRGECQTMAKYIQLLEARVGQISNGDGRRHQIQNGHAPETPTTPLQPDGSAQKVSGHNPQLTHHSSHVPPSHSASHGHPVRASGGTSAPAQHHPPQPTRSDTRPVRGQPTVRPPSDDEDEGSGEDDSPPVSNRRNVKPPPPRQPVRKQPPPRAARPPPPRPDSDEEEEKQDSERRARVPNRPPAAKSAPPPKKPSEEPKKKRFVGKGDDEEEQPMVSGRRSGPKSILKNGESAAKENSADVDADLLGDIETVAKSSKRDDSEGREDAQTSAKARMDRTKAIAAAMQKKREERQSSVV